MGILSGFHLQFIIDKKVEVLFDILLVDHSFGIVLIVRVFKLRAAYRLTVDSHNRRIIVALCISHSCHEEHGGHHKSCFHILYSCFLRFIQGASS